MKVLSIGDIHGRDVWKRVDPNEWDLIIFVGDYVDSHEHDMTPEMILTNLEEIVSFKNKYNDKVILLLGNHDMSYINSNSPCSGWNGRNSQAYADIYRNNEFKISHQIDNYLWTHAGVHRGWWDTRAKQHQLEGETVADTLNRMYEWGMIELFDCGWSRGGGQKVGGPIWVHKTNIYEKPLLGYHHIVGHNRVKSIKYYDHYQDPNTSVAFIDVLTHTDDFYELEIS